MRSNRPFSMVAGIDQTADRRSQAILDGRFSGDYAPNDHAPGSLPHGHGFAKRREHLQTGPVLYTGSNGSVSSNTFEEEMIDAR